MSKGVTTCPTTSWNPSLWHPSWLNKVCTTGKDSESEWFIKNNPETNLITIKPEAASHVTEQFSWVPLSSCFPSRHPFPIKSRALKAHVSPRTIHFWVLDKSPILDPGRGPLSYNSFVAGKGTSSRAQEWALVCCSVAQSGLTLWDSMDCSTPGFPVLHHLLELAQTHVHWVRDTIQPSHPLASPSPPAFNLSQYHGVFQWEGSSHQVAKVLELQLHYQSFQWILSVDFL